ncbi:hypothetical protein [Sphingomonas sp. HMP6]|uniref:hypothetical protein n=1 Tax=Sphingomonas sp. HMP6 TaxID=1517551 RepID=UPI001596CB3F|nr:hypothetical protein [Sphingomonas sp. HMP6]BCA60223.1 hypothetical protein HMP06_2992 [Sphingomonas sp. HMP6]
MADMTHTRIQQRASRPLSVCELATAQAAAEATRDRAIEIVALASKVYREKGMTLSAEAFEGLGETIAKQLELHVVVSHL